MPRMISARLKFNKDTGQPVLTLRGHDVEEFTGVVRRYGASKEVQELVDAGQCASRSGSHRYSRVMRDVHVEAGVTLYSDCHGGSLWQHYR